MHLQTTTPATAAMPFRGWFRQSKGRPWQCLAEAEGYSDCLNRLLDAIADRRGGESLVCQYDPNPKRRASR